MTTFRIQGGTPCGSESLCDSCYWAHIQKGYAESEEVVLCAFLRPAAVYSIQGPSMHGLERQTNPEQARHGRHRLGLFAQKM